MREFLSFVERESLFITLGVIFIVAVLVTRSI
jgi:hypothetical protein